MPIHTREQRLAAGVYEFVRRIADRNDTAYTTSYGSMAHKLPVLIRTAGLMQALEFVAARPPSQQAQRDLLGDLATVLGYPTADALCVAVRGAEIGAYMRLTQEALQALLWFKRFAQSVLSVEGGADEQSP